jgi:hypothetical protein
MGNCCKVVKKENQKPIGENVTITTEDRSQRQKTLTVTCKDMGLSLTLRYRPTIPLSDLKDQIVSNYPDLNVDRFTLFRDEDEILDPTATLQQLGIAPGDNLTLVIKEEVSESQDIIASESHSFAQPNEEIKTVDVNSVNAKKGMASRNIAESGLTSPKKPAKELWRTALPSPPSRPLINCDPLDASSFTNNTQDKSLKANQPAFNMKLPRAGVESDESGVEGKNLAIDVENNAEFQDLKGPFYMFQKG